MTNNHPLPARFQHLPLWVYACILVFFSIVVSAIQGLGLGELTVEDWMSYPQQLAVVFGEMFPPSVERLDAVFAALLQTLQMSIVATTIGVPLSLIPAVLASKNLSPHPVVYYLFRGFISFLRTTPALIWAIFLIAAFGLGPRTGTFTLVIVTIGFCGRFFAEAMEEINPGPAEALETIGSSRSGIVFGAAVPAAMPSFVNTALFIFEQNTRSSTVLGIVGAGGIGIELMVSIKTFRYDEAITIIALVLVTVVFIESLCGRIRRRIQ